MEIALTFSLVSNLPFLLSKKASFELWCWTIWASPTFLHFFITCGLPRISSSGLARREWAVPDLLRYRMILNYIPRKRSGASYCKDRAIWHCSSWRKSPTKAYPCCQEGQVSLLWSSSPSISHLLAANWSWPYSSWRLKIIPGPRIFMSFEDGIGSLPTLALA